MTIHKCHSSDSDQLVLPTTKTCQLNSTVHSEKFATFKWKMTKCTYDLHNYVSTKRADLGLRLQNRAEQRAHVWHGRDSLHWGTVQHQYYGQTTAWISNVFSSSSTRAQQILTEAFQAKFRTDWKSIFHQPTPQKRYIWVKIVFPSIWILPCVLLNCTLTLINTAQIYTLWLDWMT